MREQEVYKQMLKKMIAKTENNSIQTSEQLIQALITEISNNKQTFQHI